MKTLRKTKKMLILIVSLVMILGSSMTVFAGGTSTTTSVTTADSEKALQTAFVQGYSGAAGTDSKASKSYAMDGGGYVSWNDLVDGTSANTGYINETNFNTLTASAKREFLTDMIDISNDTVDSDYLDEAGVSTDTQTSWLNNVQNCSGVGSQLMTTLLDNTKPDFVTANKLYEPFSGVVGTILGLGAILIMAALAITMILDLSYIGIPAFRMICDGDGDGQAGGGQASKPKFISYEAVSSVQMAEGGAGGTGQNGGSNKAAIGMYFKKRVIMLIILGICLLYLIQGQIFILVGWILDLTSGFLGF